MEGVLLSQGHSIKKQNQKVSETHGFRMSITSNDAVETQTKPQKNMVFYDFLPNSKLK